MSGTQELVLTREQQQTMLDDVSRRGSEEACGLLGGRDGTVRQVIPVTNSLHSSLRYRMDGQEQYDAFMQFEDQGWELLGIYHSHPGGPAAPSAADIAEAYYPEAVQLIWGWSGREMICRAYTIRDSEVEEIKLHVTG